MSRSTFSPSIRDRVIQAFVGSGASSKFEFYNTILPEVWTQEGFNKPIPTLNIGEMLDYLSNQLIYRVYSNSTSQN